MVTYPKDWEIVDLGDILEFKNGLNKDKAYFGHGTPIVNYMDVYKKNGLRSNDIKGSVSLSRDEIRRFEAKKNDVFFTRTSETPEEVGISAVLLDEILNCVFSGFVLRGRPKTEGLSPEYCQYCFGAKEFRHEIIKHCTYTTRALTNGKVLSAIKIPLPPLAEQKAIAATLSSFDTHIDNLTALIEKKKAIRDGALADLMSGRTRLAGFSGEWEEVSFNQVITPKARIGWQGLKKHEYLSTGYSYLISGTDFLHGTISLENISYVSQERYDMDENIQVSTDDVLVTKDGTIGKVAIVPELEKPATLNSGVFVFRTSDRLLPRFLYRVLSSFIFKEFIGTLSAGSTIKHLYQKDLKNFVFQIPVSLNEQKAIADTLTSMDTEIQNLEAERDKMQAVQAGAMEDLLTGRVRLPM